MGIRLNKNGAEEPVFDYSQWSYKAQRDLQNLHIRFQHVGRQIDEADPAMPEDEFETLLAKYDTYRREIEFSTSRYVVSVPRDWVMASAPEKLDWSKAETLDWLRGDHWEALKVAASEARSPEGISGN